MLLARRSRGVPPPRRRGARARVSPSPWLRLDAPRPGMRPTRAEAAVRSQCRRTRHRSRGLQTNPRSVGGVQACASRWPRSNCRSRAEDRPRRLAPAPWTAGWRCRWCRRSGSGSRNARRERPAMSQTDGWLTMNARPCVRGARRRPPRSGSRGCVPRSRPERAVVRRQQTKSSHGWKASRVHLCPAVTAVVIEVRWERSPRRSLSKDSSPPDPRTLARAHSRRLGPPKESPQSHPPPARVTPEPRWRPRPALAGAPSDAAGPLALERPP